MPSVLPTELTTASFLLDENSFQVNGVVVCPDPDPNESVPPVRLGQVGISMAFAWKPTTSFDLQLNMVVAITPQDTTRFQTALLLGSLSYDTSGGNSSWQLAGSLQDLNFGTLYSFFAKDSQDAAMSILENITIKELDLVYNYVKSEGGSASDFQFNGAITLGELELDMAYTYTPEKWTITATLGTSEQTPTSVNSILSSVVDGIDLPDFVGNVLIDPSSSNSPLFSFHVEKSTPQGDDPAYLVFTTSLHIEALEFVFSQYRNLSWPDGTSPKRFIKVTLASLPPTNIPIIDKLEQPFDEAYFLWVQDESGQGSEPGLTRAEVEMLIAEQATGASALLFKDDKRTPAATDVVITAGFHFVLVLNVNGTPTVVLDYPFGSSTSSPQEMLIADDQTSSDDGSTKAPLAKSFGPLSISNIGLQYKNQHLIVLLDATFKLGPIELTLLGFGLDLDFSQGATLQKLPGIGFQLMGMGVLFNNPPVMIAGLFEHYVTEQLDLYLGGIGVAFEPYLFAAQGAYGIVTINGGQFKTFFVFAKLEGPLIELEFAEISGICGGFGYNSNLTLPTAAQVPSFPLIGNNTTPGQSPLDTMVSLCKPGGWVMPTDGNYWIAAGLKVTALQVLSINAVVVVEFGGDVKLGIFADCIASFPPETPQAELLLYVELGLSAIIDFGAGTMKIEGQLAPTSFVLNPSCHLTGGFAMYYWFGDNSDAGDWVFTVGGYHPAYQVPIQYPTPQRLQIAWSIDSNLSILGQAYFAVTPKVCMGGGMLQASLSIGPLQAAFNAYADFLINYQPFSFDGQVGISVSVQFTLDLWICSIHISVEIGANLHIYGPPVAGVVHVDFWVFGFDIHFGSDSDASNPASLPEFYQLLLQSKPGAMEKFRALAAAAPEDDAGQAHVITCETGLDPGAGGQASTPSAPWNVRAGTFTFRVQCIFAINSAAATDGEETSLKTDVFGKPMQLVNALSSTLVATITSDEEGEGTVVWRIAPVIKQEPQAIWGKCMLHKTSPNMF